MALKDLANVNIGLQTTGISQTVFGIPIFIGAHRHFPERVRSYSSMDGVAADIPAGSDEYKAAQGFFSAIPSPSQIMIGRREADVELSIPLVEENEVYSFTITVNDGADALVSYTAAAGNTAEDVVDAFVAAITAATAIDAHVTATKVGTGASTTLTIESAAPGDVFSLSGLSQVEAEYTTTETAPEVLQAVIDENNTFYMVTAHDHTEDFVLDMAEAIEAMPKVYVTSVATANSLTTLADPPIDIGGKLADLDYFRTTVFFHHSADTEFPETSLISKFITKQPGTTTWEEKELAGVGISRNPTTLKSLSQTEINNLRARNMSFVERLAGVNLVLGGKVASGEWIDTITSRDLLTARLEEAIIQYRLWQDKIPMTNPGINSYRSVVETVASRYVETDTQPNILEANLPYELTFPRRETLSATDVANGTYTATGKFYLSGAIRLFTFNAVMTYRV